MRNKKWGNMLAMAMAATVTVTSVPFSANAEEGEQPVNTEAADTGDGYHLVWSDEFNGDSLNTEDWNVEQHEPGWVNAELQRYTALDEGNISVSDGALHIIPKYTAGEESQEGSEAGEENQEAAPQNITAEFTASESIDTGTIQVNFGKIDDSQEGNAQAEVILSNLSFIDETEGKDLLKVGEVSDGNAQAPKEWIFGTGDSGVATYESTNGNHKIKIENSGGANWNVQLKLEGITLIAGHTYQFSMDAVSDNNRKTEIGFMNTVNWAWYGGIKTTIEGSKKVPTQKAGEEFTSGRITTQGKHDFTYGRFEARAKVPTGQGFLPAFWLMASDEGLYGQWPKCGEIDIMEVMGQRTDKSYHTIHYGYNSGTGHKENQGTKMLSDSSFADEYHVFRADWEPGLITWYVDNEKVYETRDWYTGTDDENQTTYPAPFDQDFYIILNLAIGGSWVGYPDKADYNAINNEEYVVDYVRVYQKDESTYKQAEENAKRPEKEPVVYREAVDGNYVLNGNFANAVAIDDPNTDDEKEGWVLHLEDDAAGSTAEMTEEGLKITPSEVGSQNYSVQLKQAGVPMYKGWEYELSFDAVSTEDRSIIVDVEGPDHGWVRYFNDTTANVGTTKQHYSYKFTMNEKTDANSVVEFNLGNQGSTAPVTISNVVLKHVDGEEIKDESTKVIRPDGNYVYNGSFDQGDQRLGYWEFDEEDKAQISVTNEKNKRELMVKVEVPEGASEVNPVTISQSDLAPLTKGQYDFSFSAYTVGGEADGITAKAAGAEFAPTLTEEKQTFSNVVTVDNNLTREESNVEFTFTKPGTYYLDNVFLTEKSLLKNGSFNAGTSSYKVYVDGNAKANYVVDSMNGNDNTFAMTIEDTDSAAIGTNDWYIQLNQDGIQLEEGKYYLVGFNAKASIDRKIKYSIQHNGESDNDWTEYCGNEIVEIGSEWKKFSKAFQMSKTDDARFNITMGSVAGERITDKHDVYIDDIELVEITKEEFDKLNGNASETPSEENNENAQEQPGTTPEVNPGTQPAAGEEQKTETPAIGNTDPASVQPIANTDANTETQPAANPENEAGAQPDTNTEGKTETGSEVQPVAQTETPAVVTPETQSEVSNEVKPETNSEVQNTSQPVEVTPVVFANRKDSSKAKSKMNNNGKAEKGEVKVTKNSIYKVTSKKAASYKANPDSTLKSISVPSTSVVDGTKLNITKIEKDAFKNNKNVKTITIGKNVTTIEKGAFAGCENLKKIIVKGDKLKKVNKSAFKNCKIDEKFTVVIYAKKDKDYERIVKLFKKAGLKKATFVRK